MKRRLGFLIQAVLLLYGLCSGPIARAGEASADIAASLTDVSSHLLMLEDQSHRLTIADVTSGAVRFVPHAPSHSYGAHAYWFLLSLENNSAETRTRWLAIGNPRLQRVDLYERGQDGWQAQHAGTWVPRERRPLIADRIVFPLQFQPHETKILYFKIESETTITTTTLLWEPQAFLRAMGEQNLPRILVIGGILTSAALSLIVFLHLREASYLWFALLLLCGAILETIRNGLFQQYIWPASLPFYTPITMLVGGTELVCMTMLVQKTLDLPKYFPRYHRAFTAIRLITILSVLICAVNYRWGAQVISWISIITVPILLSVLITAWRRGLRQARFLLLSVFLLFLVETLRLMTNLGLLPTIPLIAGFNSNAALLASTPLIFFAMAERTRQLSQELLSTLAVSQAKSEFLAKISHDLRAPLNTMIGYARLLKRKSTEAGTERALGSIERNGIRLLGLIDELLDEARLQTGRLSLSLLPVHLGPWLEEMCQAARMNAQANGNAFIFQLDGELPERVMMDTDRLHQVFDNLIGNAIRHTRNGQIRLVCRSEPEGPKIRLRFAVHDTGDGIPPEHLATIFESFVRLPSAKFQEGNRPSGLGLGLSIARELIRRMGGDISVQSEPGSGSIFRFSIRCDPATGADAPKPAENDALPPASDDHPAAARILLVEDDPDAADLLVQQLHEAGFHPEPVASGQDAIPRLIAMRDGRESWDIVLTDQRMQGGDGWMVLRNAREYCPDVPVVLLSSAAPQRPKGFPQDLRFDSVLRKPASPILLRDTISAIRNKSIKPVDCSVTDNAFPPEAALRQLLGLIRNGELTSIYEWVDDAKRSHPDCIDFLNQIAVDTHQLKFGIIETKIQSLLRD